MPKAVWQSKLMSRMELRYCHSCYILALLQPNPSRLLKVRYEAKHDQDAEPEAGRSVIGTLVTHCPINLLRSIASCGTLETSRPDARCGDIGDLRPKLLEIKAEEENRTG